MHKQGEQIQGSSHHQSNNTVKDMAAENILFDMDGLIRTDQHTYSNRLFYLFVCFEIVVKSCSRCTIIKVHSC